MYLCFKIKWFILNSDIGVVAESTMNVIDQNGTDVAEAATGNEIEVKRGGERGQDLDHLDARTEIEISEYKFVVV